VEEHLAGCEACAHERASLAGLARLASLVPDEELPAGLHARILTRLAYADAPAPVLRAPAPVLNPFRALWTGTAFAGMIAAAGFAYLHTRPATTARRLPRELPSLAGRPARTPVARADGHPAEERRTVESAPSQIVATAEPAAPAPAQPTPDKLAPVPAPGAAPAPVRVAEAAPLKSGVIRPVKPALSRETRPQPAALTSGAGKAITELREAEPPAPPAAASDTEGPAMPGSPVVNAVGNGGQPEPVVTAMEKDATTRMAGMAVEVDTPSEEEDEGLSALRNFFEERNKNVPQPPIQGSGRDRRMRKSL
jgi:hypothetical protein